MSNSQSRPLSAHGTDATWQIDDQGDIRIDADLSLDGMVYVTLSDARAFVHELLTRQGTRRTCEGCRFWLYQETLDDRGTPVRVGPCRLNPPVPHMDGQGRTPRTKSSDWCSRWDIARESLDVTAMRELGGPRPEGDGR